MKLPAISLARVFVLLQAFSGLLIADAPPLLTTGVEIGSSNERTALSRTTRKLSSTVDVKIKNTSDRLLEAPLHAVISFTPLNGGNLAGLTMPGALGGVGVAPYQTFYKDLSASIGNGLAVGAETTFSFTFERPEGTTVSYAVAIRGIRNRDPNGLIGGPYSGQLGSPLPFDASNSTDPDGEALTFSWDFGDGSTGTGAKPQHAYSTTGLFSVVVTVSDPRGAVVTRETQVPISPSGAFALARTRTLDGNGHPLGTVAVTQSGPDGSRTFQSDTVSGFASLGGQPGDHTWSFARDGYLTSFRKTTLTQGSVKVVSFPWLAPLNASRTTLSLLNPTSVKSPAERVTLTLPPQAFEQVVSVALTDLHGQNLPLPLPYGWSPLAAFHLDAPATSAADIAASVKLLQAVPPSRPLVLVHLATATPTWLAESLPTSTGGDTLAVVLRKSGSYAVVIADTLPAGNPALAEAGQPLPAGAAAAVAPEVTAAGVVNPAATVASLDPARVTATATVDFTNGTQPLASGAWFLADVEETYDLRDGQAFKTPDYDATFYAYQTPGDASASTATASFPLRPRILFGPDQLTEANLKVDVLALNQFSGGIVTQAGGLLSLPGLRIGIPAGAVASPSAAEIRLLSIANLSRFLGEFQPLLAFEINLPPLADGTALDFSLTQKLAPDSNFVLARCVGSGSESGLQPVLRLRSDSQGNITSAEPASGPKLPGITGSGQYVVVKINESEALITGLVRNVGGSLLPGALVRVTAEPWLSLTGGSGTFAILAKPGERIITASNPADGNSGQATASLANAASNANVEIQTAATGPHVVATTPAASDPKASKVAPITVEFSEPIQPGSFGANGIRLHDVSANADVPGSLNLDRSNRKAILLPLNPLNNAADYQIIVSNTILDKQNLPIEGTLTFPFKTAPGAERPAGAQLVIYEPDAINLPAELVIPGYDPAKKLSRVVAVGSPGTADPEVPVVLVNETTGETATVISKPDGSFANFINAAEDEGVSATFVNENGTRVTVRATRQLFDDGRVGLFAEGGILEAQSDGGPIQVIVAPGATAERSVFKVQPLDVSRLLGLLEGAEPPAGSQLFGGVRVEIEGSSLKESVDISIPIDPATLQIPPGADPSLGVYALTKVTEVNGMKVLEVLDKMEYKDGRLSTASPPFIGLIAGGDVFATLITFSAQGGKAVLTGRVKARPGGISGTEEGLPVPGAVVYIDPLATEGSGAVAPLAPGRFVAVADANGSYRLLSGLPAVTTQAVALGAVSNRFPGLIGFGVATRVSQSGLLAMTGSPFFNSNTPLLALQNLDTSPPSITFAQPSRGLAVTRKAIPLHFLATDNAAQPSLEVKLISIEPLPGDPPILPTQFTFSAGAPASSGLNTRIIATLTSQRQAKVTLRATASDGVGNLPIFSDHVFFVQDSQIILDLSDSRGPYVLFSAPQHGAAGVDRLKPIQVIFNEPIDTSKMEDLVAGIALRPPAGRPYISFTEDQREFSLIFPELRPDREIYRLVVSGTFIRDLAGNPLDQDNIPDRVATDFIADFVTANETSTSAPVQNGGGVVEKGGYFYFIDRGQGGQMRVIRKAATDTSANLVTTEQLLDYPRDIILIEDYSYRVPTDGAPEVRRNRDLVVITGGEIGSVTDEGAQTPGAWLQVFDVTDPEHLKSLVLKNIGDSPSSAFVKLDWSPPNLGILELNASETAIHYVDLPLFIWANHRLHQPLGDPPNGIRGVDINGDGDYDDQPGDLFPAPIPTAPSVGLINAGLVATFLPTPGAGRFTDFDMQFGGRFLGVTGTGVTGGGGYYQTLIDGGLVLTGANAVNAIETISGNPKRILTLFRIPLAEAGGGTTLANLALVSEGARLIVIDITNVAAPAVLTELDLTKLSATLGLAQSALLRTDGLVALSCTGGQILLDPTRFLLPLQAGAPNPAVLGFRSGIGSTIRAFVSRGDLFAVNSGASSLLSAEKILIPVTLTSIFAEDINDPAPTPFNQPVGFVAPLPVIRKSSGGSQPDVPLIEITDQIIPPKPMKVRLTAVFDPPNVPVSAEFPEWKLNGVTVAKGPRVEISIPVYSNPGGGTFPTLVNLLDAQTHTITAAGKTLTVAVYPGIKSEDKVDLTKIVEKLGTVVDTVEEAVKEGASGLVTGSFDLTFPKTVTFALANQWKECDDPTNANLHKVFWTFDAESGFDPLFGVAGRVKIGPKIAFVKAVIFVELYGQITLKGKLSRDQSANLSGTAALGGKMGVKAGIEPDLKLFEAVIEADAPVSAAATVTASAQNITSSFAANFDGLIGKVTVKVAGGIFEFSNEVSIIPGFPIIPPTQDTLLQFKP